MDGTNGSATPDLQALLATLARYSPTTPGPASASVPVAFAHNEYAGSPTPPVPEEALQPAPGVNLDPLRRNEDVLPRVQDPRIRPQDRSAVVLERPLIDPATITTWQEGIRCVTKIAASNAQFAVSIKRMMKDQRESEIRWYKERQHLKQTQANRSASAAKARSILNTLNTSFYGEPPAMNEPAVDKEVELAGFDRKIYIAQIAMETAMTAELKGLGVPFFGTDQTLVAADDCDVTESQPSESLPGRASLITESQLMELRRRMVSHMEDLYRD